MRTIHGIGLSRHVTGGAGEERWRLTVEKREAMQSIAATEILAAVMRKLLDIALGLGNPFGSSYRMIASGLASGKRSRMRILELTGPIPQFMVTLRCRGI